MTLTRSGLNIISFTVFALAVLALLAYIVDAEFIPRDNINMKGWNITNTTKIQTSCLNLSGDYKCAWPAGGSSNLIFNSPLYNNTLTNVSFNGSAANVNSSTYSTNATRATIWGSLNGTNTSQFENSNGLLHLLDTFLTNFVNAWLATKSTDNLAQGSTNKYDNQTFNETRTGMLYIRLDNASVATWNQANGSWNETKAGQLFIRLDNSSVAIWNQANGSWNETRANNIFIRLDNASVATWNQANGSWNESKASTLYIHADNTSVSFWNSWTGNYTACTSSQKLYFNGRSLACANDIDTNTYNTTQEMFNAANNGTFINYLNSSVSYWNSWTANYTACTSTQKLYFNGRSLACNNDVDTNTYNTTQEMFNAANNGTFINYLNGSVSSWNSWAGNYTACTSAQKLYFNGRSLACNNDVDTNTYNTTEEMQDAAGAMFGGTEDGIDVTYQDASNNVDFTFDCSDVVSTGLTCTGEDIIINWGDNLFGWTNITDASYPAACASGEWVTTIGDTNTCSAPTAADVDAGTYPAGNYIYQGNVTSDGFKLGDNEKIYAGDSDDAKSYFNGTCWRTEVGTTIFAVCP